MADSESVREVYAQFGLAAYHAQCLEIEVVNLLLHHFMLRKEPVTRADLEAVDEAVTRETLGQALKRVRALVDFDKELLTVIERARELRNSLAHDFFRVHSMDLQTHDGREKMVKELAEARKEIIKADFVLHTITSGLAKKLGIEEDLLGEIIADYKKGRIWSEEEMLSRLTVGPDGGERPKEGRDGQ